MKIITKKFPRLVSFLILALFIAVTTCTLAYADSTIPDEYRPINQPFPIEFTKGDAATPAVTILQIIAGGLLYFAAPIAVIMLIMAGYDFVMGGADSDKVEQAKKNITWTVIGLILIIMSYSAVRVVIGIALGSATEPTTIETTEPTPEED